MEKIKVVIEPEKKENKVGPRSGGFAQKLEPMVVQLPELLQELQQSARQSINVKSKLTIQLQATISASESIEPGIQVPVFKLSGKKDSNETGGITFNLETEIEPDVDE